MKKFIFAMLVGIWIMTGFCVVAQEEAKPTNEGRTTVYDVAPVRVIEDPYPTFNGMAVDSVHNEVIMTDNNRRAFITYGRLTKAEGVTEPFRTVIGPKTRLGHLCGVAIDPENEEIFVMDTDWKQNMCVFPRQAQGNQPPLRELNIDLGAWGIFLDRKNEEVAIANESVNKISVYRRTAEGHEKPLRIIQGPNTGLADPHGVVVDAENNEIFVSNHGHWRKTQTGEEYKLSILFGEAAKEPSKKSLDALSTGKFLHPSIMVYSRTANGDAAPLRTIQGSKTQLNWPSGIYLDPVSDQIVVANTGNKSILFFKRTASGDVAPVRVIKGEATGLDNPVAVVVDTKNNEIWATNWDAHTATVYARTAEGNVAPLRTIRSAPRGTPPSVGFAGPAALNYDPKRKQILFGN